VNRKTGSSGLAMVVEFGHAANPGRAENNLPSRTVN
jgi:hypothetical protein